MRPFSYGELDVSFFDESSELLENAADLVVMAERAQNVAPAIPEVFRTFHSIKGGAQMVGCEMLAKFAHQMEDLLDQIRTGRRPADLAVAGLILDAVSLMEEEISRYRQYEHPDELASRQAALLDRVNKMNQRQPVAPEVPVATVAALSEEIVVAIDGKRLVYILFKINEAALMPEISEILVGLRLQENERVIYSGRPSCGICGLEAVLKTDLEDKQLRKACDAADVREILVKDLSTAAFFDGGIPLSASDDFQKCISVLDAAVIRPDTSHKEILDLIQELGAWGHKTIEVPGCFPGGRLEWDRALELLKTGFALRSGPRSTPEQRHLLEQLVQNLWECVFANFENKVYYFSMHALAVGEGTNLLSDVKGRIKGSEVRVMVLDISAMSVLESDGVAALMETVHWLKVQGVFPAIVAKGDFRHRLHNTAEALSDTLSGLMIHPSAYNACLAINLTPLKQIQNGRRSNNAILFKQRSIGTHAGTGRPEEHS